MTDFERSRMDGLRLEINLLRERVRELENQCEHMAIDGLDSSMAMLRIQRIIEEYQAEKIPCHCSSCQGRSK